MIHTKKLSLNHAYECHNLINTNNEDNLYFVNLGWSLNQFSLQFKKEICLGFGLFEDNVMHGFLIGDLITIEKNLEYEILLIYIKTNRRKLGYATKLINDIFLIFKHKNLRKIYLEVAINNLAAINFYKKNNFNKNGIRKNYYNVGDNKIDAFFFEKIINEI